MQVYCIGLYSRFHFQSQFPPPPPQTWLTVTAESHLHLSDQCIGCVKLILFVVQLLGIEIEIVSKKDLKWDTLEFFLWSRRFIRSRSQSRRRVKITLFFVISWSFGVTAYLELLYLTLTYLTLPPTRPLQPVPSDPFPPTRSLRPNPFDPIPPSGSLLPRLDAEVLCISHHQLIYSI